MIQALYGITDKLTAAVYVPIVMHSRVATNLSWEPGDYQSQLGRAYSEEDFWGWASSLGQPRVPAVWEAGVRLADIVLGARYLLPQTEWMSKNHFRWSATLQVALPTGTNFDPEEAVSVGTNLWELHAAGDVEAHVSADKHFFVDEYGVYRLNIGADLFYAFFRPREYKAGHGLRNPLLNNNAFYVGDTYIVDGGDWLAGTISIDVVPFLGPTRASIVSGRRPREGPRLARHADAHRQLHPRADLPERLAEPVAAVGLRPREVLAAGREEHPQGHRHRLAAPRGPAAAGLRALPVG